VLAARWPLQHRTPSWCPDGRPLRESNWKRSVGWSAATTAAGLQGFRVHDLRHTAASVWLGAGADPKVVQRVLGHATASMTMDLWVSSQLPRTLQLNLSEVSSRERD